MGLIRERAKMELIRERAYERWAYKGEDLSEMGLIRERAY